MINCMLLIVNFHTIYNIEFLLPNLKIAACVV